MRVMVEVERTATLTFSPTNCQARIFRLRIGGCGLRIDSRQTILCKKRHSKIRILGINKSAIRNPQSAIRRSSTVVEYMKVFVIGSGGREHALVWSLARSPRVKQIYSATANAGILKQTTPAGVSAGDMNSIAEFAAREKIDLVVV